MGVITLLATSLGFVTGYLSLVPRISVSQTFALNPAAPFSAPFVVSNDGPLGINEISFSCLLLYVESSHRNRFIDVLLSDQLTIVGMEPGEKVTIRCPFERFVKLSESDPIVRGDIVLIVEFRPDLVPWQVKRQLRFITLHGFDGRLYWYPQPYSRIGSNNN